MKRLFCVFMSGLAVAPHLSAQNAIVRKLSCEDAGANDTYACNISVAPAAYETGVIYWFKANTANTGAATINFNSLGAKTIKKVAGGITTDLSDNDIRAGQWVAMIYDGTNMQMFGQLGNAGGGSGTPGGSDTQVQFNDGGTNFGGDAGLTYNKTTDELTAFGGFISGDGTESSMLSLPELAANGNNFFRIYGADTQAADGCIIVSGQPGNDEILKGTASTAMTTDGQTCRVMAWEADAGGGGTPAGSDNYIQYNISSAFAAEAEFIYDPSNNLATITKNALGTTPSGGWLIQNTTDAAAGAQQVSPPLILSGEGWKTDATAASQVVSFRMHVLPAQGAANPTGSLYIQSSINGGAYGGLVEITSGGVLGTAGAIYGAGFNATAGTGITLNGGNSAITASGGGVLDLLNAPQTSFDRLNFGPATSSMPALKKSTTRLQFRLGDDSAYTGFDTLDVDYQESTVAGLPACDSTTKYRQRAVSDASSPSMGATVSGGGAAAALVWCNGTNWTVTGV